MSVHACVFDRGNKKRMKANSEASPAVSCVFVFIARLCSSGLLSQPAKSGDCVRVCVCVLLCPLVAAACNNTHLSLPHRKRRLPPHSVAMDTVRLHRSRHQVQRSEELPRGPVSPIRRPLVSPVFLCCCFLNTVAGPYLSEIVFLFPSLCGV